MSNTKRKNSRRKPGADKDTTEPQPSPPPRLSMRQLKDQLDGLLGRVATLESQLQEAMGWQHRARDLERRFEEHLAHAGPATSPVEEERPQTVAEQIDSADGVMRADTFGPETVRASTSRHSQSVSKALGMLGLVPDAPVDNTHRSRSSESHKRALGKALEMFGISGRSEKAAEPAPEPPSAPAPAPAPARVAVAPAARPNREAPEPVAISSPAPETKTTPASKPAAAAPVAGEVKEARVTSSSASAIASAAAAMKRLRGDAGQPAQQSAQQPAQPEPETPLAQTLDASTAAVSTPDTAPDAAPEQRAVEVVDDQVAAHQPARAVEETAPEPRAAEQALSDAALGAASEEALAVAAEVVAPAPVAVAPDKVVRWEAESPGESDAPVDLEAAVAVDLVSSRSGAVDVAVGLLNGAVMVGAVGAALYAGGATSREALGTGCGAAFLGAVAISWKAAPQMVRAALGGLAVLLMHALAVIVVGAQAPDLIAAAPIFLATSLVGSLIIQSTQQPLAIFLGLPFALLLPAWFALPSSLVLMSYALAINAGTAWASLRLRRLQPSVLGAILTVPIMVQARGDLAALMAAIHVVLYLGQSLAAPFLHRRASGATFVLAVLSFCFAGWTAHGLYEGSAYIAATGLFAVATICAFVASKLPRTADVLRGAMKAGAVILVLSALPLGFAGATLAAVGLAIAFLLAVYARMTFDAYLRAAGSLVLVASVAVLARHGLSPTLSFVAAVVATLLYSVRARGPRTTLITGLLAAMAYGTTLHGLALWLPIEITAWAWAVLGLAFGAIGRAVRSDFAYAGAACAAGAAGIWALVVSPQASAELWLIVAATSLQIGLAWNHRALRELFALLVAVLTFGALQLVLPGPLGPLSMLALLPLWLLQVPAPWRTPLRTHARFLVLVLLIRTLLPDVSNALVTTPWLNLRTAALLGVALAGLITLRVSRVGQVAFGVLAVCAMAAPVFAETRDPMPVLAAVAAASVLAFLIARRRSSVVVIDVTQSAPAAHESSAAAEAPTPRA